MPKASELRSRVTGLSLPLGVGGLSWQPREPDVTAARRVLVHLGDRRVLFDPFEVEVTSYCTQSVLEIRQMLTTTLAEQQRGAELAGYLDGMRAACRAYLADVHAIDPEQLPVTNRGTPDWLLNQALGIFRGRMGGHVVLIAVTFDIDVPDTLTGILPPAPDQGDDWWPFDG